MDGKLDRYHRQMLLGGFGEEGQQRLRDSTVLLLGCGALGCVAADLLSRAGVGHLVIVDRDVVELTNLQRQVLFDEDDVAEGMPKAQAARRRLAKINSDIRVSAIVDDINHSNIERLADGVDVLVDGLDNFETRYLANDVAVKLGIPYVYGAAVGTTGMAFTVLPRGGGDAAWEMAPGGSFATPCFRCLFDEPPPPGTTPTCDTVGVINSVVSVIASFQVNETLKILTQQFDRMRRTILNLDLWSNDIMQLKVPADAEQLDCPCCKHHQFRYLDGDAGSSATSLCGRNAIQLRQRENSGQVGLEAVAERLRVYGKVSVNEFLLIADIADGDEAYEITLFNDGRAIIKGTQDPRVARGLYARYIGS
ncbi:MAG: ThiF family adenylyltransferase [Gammaproteobacteria bacterium]|nr:ThiF family adenylyltransferase [Gammaproteobacteria bacterium]